MQSQRHNISNSSVYFRFQQYPGNYRERKIQKHFIAQYPAFHFSFLIGEMNFLLAQLFQSTFLDASASRIL